MKELIILMLPVGRISHKRNFTHNNVKRCFLILEYFKEYGMIYFSIKFQVAFLFYYALAGFAGAF